MRIESAALLLASFGLALALAACPGKLDDPDKYRYEGEGGGVSCPEAPKEIFAVKCAGSGCHSPPTPAAGLDLVSDGVDQRVVDVQAKGCSGNLGDPTDPEGSILYMKLTGEPPCGDPMPLGGTPLTADELLCVRHWIVSLQPQGTGGSNTGGSNTGGSNTGGGGTGGSNTGGANTGGAGG